MLLERIGGVAVSGVTKAGLPELKQIILETVMQARARRDLEDQLQRNRNLEYA